MGLIDGFEGNGEARDQGLAVKKDHAFECQVGDIEKLYHEFSQRRGLYSESMTDTAKIFEPYRITADHITRIVKELEPLSRDRGGDNIGYFLSAMIQHSYNLGENDFSLDFNSYSHGVDLVGLWLKGSYDNKLKLTLAGALGGCIGKNSRYTKIRMIDTAGYGCGSAIDSEIIFENGAQGTAAQQAHNCTFELYGQFSSAVGILSRNCTFYAHSKQTAHYIKRNESYNMGNTVYWVTNGEHIEIGDLR